MSAQETDTRTITLVDLPLVARLSGQGTVLDSERGLTGDARGPHSVLLSSLLFRSNNIHTIVARSDKQQVVGQFRVPPDDPNAHIIYIAPRLEGDVDNTVWLHILDAMAKEAGKHRAQALVAEVEETSQLFETMRNAGFAVYMRQQIWRRHPDAPRPPYEKVVLHEVEDLYSPGLWALFGAITPSMVQQIAAPPSDMALLAYYKNQQVEGFIALSEGKQGIYMIPYLHQDLYYEATDIIESAIDYAERAAKVPVYVCIRRYQNWLEPILHDSHFRLWIQQAVMVKHIAAGVRQARFSPVRTEKREAVPAPVGPPGHLCQCEDDLRSENS